MENLHNTINKIFPHVILEDINIVTFTPEFIKDIIHKNVMYGLLHNAGEYRTCFCKPAMEDWYYLIPSSIEKSLGMLCSTVREKLNEELDLSTKIKIVSSFFTNFLHIHPFSINNGNGRTGRIIVSCLLSYVSPVPVILYGSNNTRKVSLDCVRNSRLQHPF